MTFRWPTAASLKLNCLRGSAVSSSASPPVEEDGVDTIFFDLDGTLYPNDCGFQDSQMRNLREFIHLLGLPKEVTVDEVLRPLLKKHDDSFIRALRALEAPWPLKAFDSEAMYQFVRKDGEQILKEDVGLYCAMMMLPQRKFVFTNTNEQSARHTLRLLGLSPDLFDGIIGASSTDNVAKPSDRSFRAALHIAGRADQPWRCAMFEDSLSNLRTARRLGLKTVLVSRSGFQRAEGREFDAAIPSISVDTVQRACPWLRMSEVISV